MAPNLKILSTPLSAPALLVWLQRTLRFVDRLERVQAGRASGCVKCSRWSLPRIFQQFLMENEEIEFKAEFRACLNQTGMKLIWNCECGFQPLYFFY